MTIPSISIAAPWMKRVTLALLLALGSQLQTGTLHGQELDPIQDSDGDQLADGLETTLLARFLPVFMVSRTDCSVAPAEFLPSTTSPTAIADNGAIYGQAFPRKGHPREVELHYYHLWRKDCGDRGHALDTEHVSALIEMESNPDSAKAIYWYAAAHEDTICDASHLAHAKALKAENHGPTVWISSGKHGSFFSELLCRRGCGSDRCEQMERLPTQPIINVGEADMPMNDIHWLQASQWPLKEKLSRSDFTDARLKRVRRSSSTQFVWADTSNRPAQTAIFGAKGGVEGVAMGARATDAALVSADASSSSALNAASATTGESIRKSSRTIWGALDKSIQKTSGILKPRVQ
jgi:hypothetical protein